MVCTQSLGKVELQALSSCDATVMLMGMVAVTVWAALD